MVIGSQTNLHPHVHSSMIHGSQDLEGTQLLIDGWMDGSMDRWIDGWINEWIDGWMDKEQVVHPHDAT